MSRTIPNPDVHPAYKNYLNAYQAQQLFKASIDTCAGLTVVGSWFVAGPDARNRGANLMTLLLVLLVPGVIAAGAVKDYRHCKAQATARERVKFQALEWGQLGGSLAKAGLIQYAMSGASALAMLYCGLELLAQSMNYAPVLLLAAIGFDWALKTMYKSPAPPLPEELVVTAPTI